MPYGLIRSLLFLLPPEAAHGLALAALRAWGWPARGRRLPQTADPAPVSHDASRLSSPVTLMGVRFPNRVGLAAGLDKDAVAVRGLARLGFGFVEVGTVTPRPQPGNPKPRLFRSVADRALINRMGFNSAGVEAVRGRLSALRRRPLDAVLGVNVGKNRNTPLEAALDDYRAGLEAVYEFADYVAVNLSSPNTPGLRSLQTPAAAAALLAGLDRARAALAAETGRRVPLAVKLAPDLADAELEEVAGVVRETGMDGVIAANTTLARPHTLEARFAAREGGLSGAPLAPLARRTVSSLRAALGDSFPIIGVGGIGTPDDARRMLDAGADAVQVYTGFVFGGPPLVKSLLR